MACAWRDWLGGRVVGVVAFRHDVTCLPVGSSGRVCVCVREMSEGEWGLVLVGGPAARGRVWVLGVIFCGSSVP